MEKLNLTITEGYPSRNTETAGLLRGPVCYHPGRLDRMTCIQTRKTLILPLCVPGPVFKKGLSQGLGLKLRLLSQVSAQNLLRHFILGLVVFTKNLRLVLGLAKGSTLGLVSSGLKFCKEDLNMAAINFSPLQNLKWL